MKRIAMTAKSSRFKYKTFMEAMPEIRDEYIVQGMTSGELHRKYSPLVERGFSLGTLSVFACRAGWKKNRGRLARARAEMAESRKHPSNVKPNEKVKADLRRHLEHNAGDLITKAIVDDQIERERKGRRKHFERMERMVDKTSEVLEEKSDHLNAKNVGEHLVRLNQFDGIARRLYGMDRKDEVNVQQFNIAVLTQLDQIPQREAISVD